MPALLSMRERVPIGTGKGTHRDRPYISEPSVNRPEPSSSADESAIESAISTQRDAVWDWLVDRFGLPVDTDTQQARVGRCVRELRAQVDAQTGVQSRTADPLEAEHVARLLDQRARNWPAHYPDATLTPEAYVKHFHALARPPLRVSADDQRRAEVQAAIAGLKEEA